MRELWDSMPKGNVGRWAKVVGVHPHVHSVDLVFLDDATKAYAVMVLSPFPASQSFGYSHLPIPDLPQNAAPDFVLKSGAKTATSGEQKAADQQNFVIKTVAITRGQVPGTDDALPDTGVAEVIRVEQGGMTFLPIADYRLDTDKIMWSPSGGEPAPGSKYSVTYRYATEVKPSSSIQADTAIGASPTSDGEGVAVVKTIIMTRGPSPHGRDQLPDTGVTSIQKVKQGSRVFDGLIDYVLTNNAVDWTPELGHEPDGGTQYTVDYTYQSKASGMMRSAATGNSTEVQQTEAKKWSPLMSGTKDVIALVQHISGIPVVTGFLPPRVDDLGFDAKNYPDLEIRRHPSGNHVVTTGDGAVEVMNPSRGIRITIGEDGKDSRLSLAGKDFQKRFKTKDGAKKGTLVVSAGGDATVVRIKKCGIEIETIGAVKISADCGVIVSGKIYAEDVIGGGVSLKHHKHGGVEPGGGLTAEPGGGVDTPSCGCA